MTNHRMEAIKQYKGIVVSHTHWDRAWYWPFERFRVRLVQTVDQVIDLLHNDPAFKSFTLDGQTVVLEDYLEVKPERRGDLERLIAARRLYVGPWYVLPDEFLVSVESIVRNLMLGHKLARQFGHVMKEGYVPDPFGHIRQLPQILQGFGLRSFIFARGMGKEIEEIGTEFWWEAPDGSKVIAVNQRDSYGNLACWGFPFEFGDTQRSLPDRETALARLRKTFASIRQSSHTAYLLFSNGVDHVPPQPQVPDLISYANERLEDLRLVHGTFSDLIDAILSSSGDEFHTYKGELVGNYHHPILLSVYSSRMYLKQSNHFCQNLLERYAEPIAAWTALEAKEDYTPFVWQAWKELLQNHPHDDICGCGVDEIHRDDVNRFDRVRQIGEHVVNSALGDLAQEIDTGTRAGKPIILYNPLNWERNGVVRLDILFAFDDTLADRFAVVDRNGLSVPFEKISVARLYRMETLAERKYTRVVIDALVSRIPPCGYTTLYVVPGNAAKKPGGVKATSRMLENELLKIRVLSDGSLSVTDKRTKQVYGGLNVFEDSEDAGDEYTYSWIEKGKTISTKHGAAASRLVKKNALGATIAISYALKLPMSLNEKRSARSSRLAECSLTTFVTLRAKSKRVDIRTEFENNAKDHRLRVLFPTEIRTSTVSVADHCDVIEREHASPRKPSSSDRFEYYGTRHQEEFVSLHDAVKGLTIATKGLPEYESTGDKRGTTLAVTLLRCVGDLSRNDYITRPVQAGPQLETPEAQCPGKHSFGYAIIPHGGNWESSESYKDALEFNCAITGFNAEKSSGKIPDALSLIVLEPAQLILSAVKRSEDRTGIVARFYNISDKPVSGTVATYRPLARADLLSLNEELIQNLVLRDDKSITIDVGPKKIMTMKLTFR